MNSDELGRLGEEVEAAVKKRAEEDALAAYRLAGKSVFLVDDDKVGIRFETFYQGAFFESYYVILAMDPESGEPSVFRHSLPHFLPLADLEEAYLASNIATFVEKVSDVLHAFVARREHVKALKDAHPDAVKDVATTLAFDVVQFTGTVPDSATTPYPISFQLIFDDLAKDIPSRVAATPANPRKRRAEVAKGDTGLIRESSRKRLKSLEHPFFQSPLPDAFASLSNQPSVGP